MIERCFKDHNSSQLSEELATSKDISIGGYSSKQFSFVRIERNRKYCVNRTGLFGEFCLDDILSSSVSASQSVLTISFRLRSRHRRGRHLKPAEVSKDLQTAYGDLYIKNCFRASQLPARSLLPQLSIRRRDENS